MILSRTSEYAIRAAIFLAIQENESSMTAKDVSIATGIPIHYLSKVLRRLVESKILLAERGHNGGFKLAKSAKSIKIVDVLVAVELSIPIKHCIFGWRVCDNKKPCLLHNRWSLVNDAFQKWARDTSLEDIRNDVDADSTWLKTFKDPFIETHKCE
jgi:Rrf2 family transcriptional regulator, iron-sulfur cluster assembly transcription factor